MRNVEEVYSALRENLDQILGNLQDGILLFTEDRRAVLVSEAARRFLQIERENILGLHARDIFDSSTALGRSLRQAIDSGTRMVKEEKSAPRAGGAFRPRWTLFTTANRTGAWERW